MRVLIINVVSGTGSTGRICNDIAKRFIEDGNECYIAYGRGTPGDDAKGYSVRIGSPVGIIGHVFLSRVFDLHGFGSRAATKKLLRWADEYKPDLVWLHNLHGYYINIDLLFSWLRDHPNVKVKWTLHDCWAFTGHCCHFTFNACEKWKSGCKNCAHKDSYPKSLLFCNSARNYKRKKDLALSVKDMEIIVPSQWLAGLVKSSFLGIYPVRVHYNTIDTDVFKPTESDLRAMYGLQDKKIVLGVANDWNEKKGLNDIIKLAVELGTDYAVVLVGIKPNQLYSVCREISGVRLPKTIIKKWNKPLVILSDKADMPAENDTFLWSEERNYLGAAVVLVPHVGSVQDLAKIYTMADVFVNPTYEDTYPTVNLEAQACGTPVITYKTGGSVESVPAENHVEKGNIGSLANRVRVLCCG